MPWTKVDYPPSYKNQSAKGVKIFAYDPLFI